MNIYHKLNFGICFFFFFFFLPVWQLAPVNPVWQWHVRVVGVTTTQLPPCRQVNASIQTNKQTNLPIVSSITLTRILL